MQTLKFNAFDIFEREDVEKAIKETTVEMLRVEYETGEKFDYNRAIQSDEEIIDDICGYIEFIQEQMNEYYDELETEAAAIDEVHNYCYITISE